MYSGKTNVESFIEAQRIAEAEDIKESMPKQRAPFSLAEERKKWEARGTVHLKDHIQGFRLTELEDGGFLLERMCIRSGQKEPYAYGIFIFHKDLLPQLRDAINEKLNGKQ